jgi:hypothetical protein
MRDRWPKIEAIKPPAASRSERIRELLAAPFAISPIIQHFWLPGVIGILCLTIAMSQDVGWLALLGAVLAAPVIWALAVLILVYFPYLLYDAIRRRFHSR